MLGTRRNDPRKPGAPCSAFEFLRIENLLLKEVLAGRRLGAFLAFAVRIHCTLGRIITRPLLGTQTPRRLRPATPPHTAESIANFIKAKQNRIPTYLEGLLRALERLPRVVFAPEVQVYAGQQ